MRWPGPKAPRSVIPIGLLTATWFVKLGLSYQVEWDTADA